MLVAIAIPIFTSQLEKSRESTDLANVRSAYAEMVSTYLTWDGTSTIDDIEVPAQQTQANWQSDGGQATTTISEGTVGGGVSVPANVKGDGSGKYTVSINTSTGAITVS